MGIVISVTRKIYLNIFSKTTNQNIWTIEYLNEFVEKNIENEIKELARTKDEENSKIPDKRFLATWVNDVKKVDNTGFASAVEGIDSIKILPWSTGKQCFNSFISKCGEQQYRKGHL